MCGCNHENLWRAIGLFVILFATVSQAAEKIGAPYIRWNKNELEINGSERLELTCDGNFPVEWVLPTFLQDQFRYRNNIWERADQQTKRIDKRKTGYNYRSTLVVKETSWLDTGNYVCRYKVVSKLTSSLYVYVRDKRYLIVRPITSEMSHEFRSVREFSPVVIPCVPSQPAVKMSLFHQGKMVYPADESEWMYDSKVGFTRAWMPPRAAGFYDCRATLNGRDGVEDMNVDFYVHVDTKNIAHPGNTTWWSNSTLPEIKADAVCLKSSSSELQILSAPAELVRVNQTFRMSFLAKSCSRKTLEISFRECKSVTECSDRWITVHKDGINSERIERSHPYSMEKLTINGRARVCGQYKCTSTCDKQSVTRFLFLKEHLVKISSSTEDVVGVLGSPISLSCQVSGPTVPSVRWLKDGLPVKGAIIRKTANGSSLTIPRVYTGHTGMYRCQFLNAGARDMQVTVIGSTHLAAFVAVISVSVVLIILICNVIYRKCIFKRIVFSTSRLLNENWSSRDHLVAGLHVDTDSQGIGDVLPQIEERGVTGYDVEMFEMMMKRSRETDEILNAHLRKPSPLEPLEPERIYSSTRADGSRQSTVGVDQFSTVDYTSRNRCESGEYMTMLPLPSISSSDVSDYVVMSLDYDTTAATVSTINTESESIKYSRSYEAKLDEMYYEWDDAVHSFVSPLYSELSALIPIDSDSFQDDSASIPYFPH